jgi:rod shape-determining protein MreB and related proteins
VLAEPSVIAIDRETGETRAVGVAAKAMLGRAPTRLEPRRPLQDGVIADFDGAEAMLRQFLRRALSRFSRPRIVVATPWAITGVERRAIEDATLRAGAARAFTIEEPLAAAIGAGLPVGEPRGNMIVDIGGGTTEVAVVSLGGIVVSQSVRVGGDALDAAISAYLRRRHRLVVGERTAEQIKQGLGSAQPDGDESCLAVRGRDHTTGQPREAVLTAAEVWAAVEEPVAQIVETVRTTLDRTPPDLAIDVLDRGIVLAGGGALLHGLDARLRRDTGIPIHVAEAPLTCVALGAGASLEELDVIARATAS